MKRICMFTLLIFLLGSISISADDEIVTEKIKNEYSQYVEHIKKSKINFKEFTLKEKINFIYPYLCLASLQSYKKMIF